MAIRSDEITSVIQKQLEGFEGKLELAEVGMVLSAGDGIARIYGLKKALAGELLELPNNVYGMVMNLETDTVGCVLFGDTGQQQEVGIRRPALQHATRHDFRSDRLVVKPPHGLKAVRLDHHKASDIPSHVAAHERTCLDQLGGAGSQVLPMRVAVLIS